VAQLVDACSDTFEAIKPEWNERKASYIVHLSSVPERVLLVSMADKLHNARAIVADLRQYGDGVWGRFNGGREGTAWYYRALVEVYRARTNGPLLRELDGVVTELERLASARAGLVDNAD
jgi:(p)ppGpp synthase/HD superfamily hydrolase